MKQTYAKAKMAAGRAAAKWIQDGMFVGIGTGSTAEYFIQSLIERCQSGLQIKAAATSHVSMKLAKAGGIPLIADDQVTELDVVVDGADEIDREKRMIKGGGGALLREKILAVSAKEMIVIIDESKQVKQLGQFPLPVEIVSFAYQSTIKRLNQKGYCGNLRIKPEGSLFVTDGGNYIYDIHRKELWESPEEHHLILLQIPGVVDTGFFIGIASRVITGYENGSVKSW